MMSSYVYISRIFYYVLGKADNDTRPDRLRFVDVKVVNQTTCQACYNTPKVRFKITDYMMCAGYMEGGRDACSGKIN